MRTAPPCEGLKVQFPVNQFGAVARFLSEVIDTFARLGIDTLRGSCQPRSTLVPVLFVVDNVRPYTV